MVESVLARHDFVPVPGRTDAWRAAPFKSEVLFGTIAKHDGLTEFAMYADHAEFKKWMLTDSKCRQTFPAL
jgi:hypothetical protein